jgi:hypothetical protein
MPFSSYPLNLVQVAFDAYNAPVQSQILQQDLALKKEEVVATQMGLQNQIGLQQDMQKIWGPGGLTAAQDASTDPTDPSMMPKFLATAAALATHGQPQAATSMLSSMSLLGYRQAQAQKAQQQVAWRKSEELGSALGAVNDQNSYDVALAKVRSEGVDPVAYGLSGDYNQDAPMIPRLAQMALTRAQQLQAQDRETAFQHREQQDTFHNSVAMMRLQQGAAHLGIASQNLDLRRQEFADKQVHEDLRDSRAQEGVDLKKQAAEDKHGVAANRVYTTVGRLSATDTQEAQGIFQQDTRTQDLPAPVQKSLALAAARQARQAVAKEMRDGGLMEEPPGSYDRHLAEAMSKMEKDGTFEKAKGNEFKFAPPPAAAKAPVQPPIPKAQVPKGIPQGSKLIGSTPNGKPVWQAPDGSKWVE